MRAFFKVSLVLLCFNLSGCGISPTTPIDDATLPSSPNSASTWTATPTRKNIPTQTSTPSPTPTKIAFPLSHYDVPDWMGDTVTDILASITVISSKPEDTLGLLFLNAETNQEYSMEIPTGIAGYFWYDTMHFGFLSGDLQQMYLLDLDTGNVSQSAVASETNRLLEPGRSLVALQVTQDESSPDGILFTYVSEYRRDDYSKNNRFSAEIDYKKDERPVHVTDLRSGQTIWQFSPSEGYQVLSFSWSTANDYYITIVEGKPEWGNDWYPVINNTHLLLFDVSTGNQVGVYAGDFGRIIWSPDGTRGLYMDARKDFSDLHYGFEKPPCILDFRTGEEKCLWNIPNHQVPGVGIHSITDNYQWTPDGQSITFVYQSYSLEGMRGNICSYDLITGDFQCPTENLAELPGWDPLWPAGWADAGWSIYTYLFSPERGYIYFCYSSNAINSDDQGGPSRDAIINIEGTKVFTWSGTQIDVGEYILPKCSFFDAIWRPLP